MANLRKRGPSQWQAQVRVCGYPNQPKTFDTRAAAERWAKATEVEMAQGAFLSRTKAQSTTLRAYCAKSQRTRNRSNFSSLWAPEIATLGLPKTLRPLARLNESSTRSVSGVDIRRVG